MISLTNQPNRALTRSLWIVLTALGSICLGVALWIAGAGSWSPLAALAIPLLLLAGGARPALVERAYFLWRRFTRGIERRAVAILTRTAFLVVSVVGRAGTDGRVDGPAAAPGWRERSPLSAAYGSLSGEAVPAERHGWLGSLVGWARRSGNGWVWALVPLLCLLRLVYGERAAADTGTTYTLY